MKYFIGILTVFFSQLAFAQDKYEAFIPADYPVDKYQIKLDSATFLTYKLEFRQIKSINAQNDSSTYCKAWVHISNKGKITKQLYFKNIEPMGGCSGIFIPELQPRTDFFLFSKLGDYNGLIFILDASGKLTEKQGGTFYISADQRYLFSPYDSDQAGITVYDLEKKRVLYSFDLEYHTTEWYFQDGNYFTVVPADNTLYSKIKIATFDLASNQMIAAMSDRNYPKPENKLKLYNQYKSQECNCGK